LRAAQTVKRKMTNQSMKEKEAIEKKGKELEKDHCKKKKTKAVEKERGVHKSGKGSEKKSYGVRRILCLKKKKINS